MTLSASATRKPMTVGERLLRWEWVLVALIVLASAINAALSPYFVNARNLFEMTFNFMERGLMVLPMTFVIITGNIDLSVASTLALTSAIMGRVYGSGVNIWAAAAIGLLFGALAGAFNGILITRVRLPALAATLGTYVLYRGLAWLLMQDGAVTNFPASFTAIGQGYIPGTLVPIQLLVFVLLAIPFGLVLHKTSFGRFTYAIGNNKEACRFSGVNINRILMIIYITSGLMAALAGLMMTGRYASVKGDIGLGAELDVITAVVLGGVDINGGSGSMPGVILALFLLGLVRYGMNLVNVPAQIQIIATGLLLIVSIILPQVMRQATAKRMAKPGTAGGSAGPKRRRFLAMGLGAVVVLVIVGLFVTQCGAPAPGGGGPAAPVQPASTERSAVATEEVVLTTPTSVAVPPTRTPRPTSTQGPTAAAEPPKAATPTPQAGTPAPAKTVAPTSTNIVLALFPTAAPAPAAGEAEMAEVPAGPATIGSNDGSRNETPVRQVDLPAYMIDKFEVTNAQYDQFTKATGYQTEVEKAGANKSWRSFFTPDRVDHPVVKMTYADANAFCAWAGKRLPTEEEWEKAARGTDQRAFPWGDLWDVGKANIKQSGIRGTVAVGSYPTGASPFGVEDLSGNVSEWTSSPFVGYPGSTYRDAQYRQEARVTRGGGWFDDQKQIRTSARNGAVQSTANDDLGFRCAADKK